MARDIDTILAALPSTKTFLLQVVNHIRRALLDIVKTLNHVDKLPIVSLSAPQYVVSRLEEDYVIITPSKLVDNYIALLHPMITNL